MWSKRLTISTALQFAPLFLSNCTISKLPNAVALCRGVSPSYIPNSNQAQKAQQILTLFTAFKSAFFIISHRTTSLWPSVHAR